MLKTILLAVVLLVALVLVYAATRPGRQEIIPIILPHELD